MHVSDLREFVKLLQDDGCLEEFSTPVSTKYEIPSMLKKHDGKKAVFFKRVKGYETQVFGGICCRRAFVAKGLQTTPEAVLEKIIHSMKKPVKPKVFSDGVCQEVETEDVDLIRDLPILTHYEKDGGPYITSGIVLAKDPETGRMNASYHRMMVIGKKRLVARLVEGRDLHRFYTQVESKGKPLEAAVVIGAPMELLVAAATSPGQMCEVDVAGGLTGSPLELVRCKTVDVVVPRYSEIVLEGKFLIARAKEGPFVDVTGCYDIVRDQPILEVGTLTKREDAFYQALLPGGMEHKLLMGLPHEAKVLDTVRSVSNVYDVSLSTAGSNWLDAVISTRKTHPNEPYLTGMAALTAHYSLKRVIIVDIDVDVRDTLAVETAVVERAHPAEDYFIIRNVKGSTLDMSVLREGGAKLTPAKLIIDATIKGERMFFEKAKIPTSKE